MEIGINDNIRWMEEILRHPDNATSKAPQDTTPHPPLTLVTDMAGRCKIHVIGTNSQNTVPRTILKAGCSLRGYCKSAERFPPSTVPITG